MELKNNKFVPIIILSIFCFVMYFAFMGSYPLIDVDETRYVRIAQEMLNSNNFLTPVINGEIFLEKPPLFFWLEDVSFVIFGVSEWSARLPMAVVATFGVFMTYFFGKKFVSERFGLISALVLGSNVIYIILSHIAILDLVLSVTMMVSVYFGIMTLYSSDKKNWCEWVGFYCFSALSVLSKGLPGIVIPFGIVFLVYLFSKRLKDLFDYKKIGCGIFILLLIVLPWHLLMYKVHGQAFIDEYILKHHLARFVNSVGINRKEPFWFYLPVIFVGFIPFIFTIIVAFIDWVKNLISNFKTGFLPDIFSKFSIDISSGKRFFAINVLAFAFIFLLFSSASTKLPTYILPAMFPLSFIVGYIFEEYFENNNFNAPIKISNIIMTTIFSVVSIAAIIILFKQSLLNIESNYFRPLIVSAFILFLVYAVFNGYNLLKNKNHKYFFASNIIFMMILTILLNLLIFNLVVDFGQKDLITFSKYAKDNNKELATFDFGHRYSTIFYYGNTVNIKEEPDYKWLNDTLESGSLVILKNKNIISMPEEVKFEVIDTGKKYTLVKKVEIKYN